MSEEIKNKNEEIKKDEAAAERMTSQKGDVVITTDDGEVLDTPEKITNYALKKLGLYSDDSQTAHQDTIEDSKSDVKTR